MFGISVCLYLKYSLIRAYYHAEQIFKRIVIRNYLDAILTIDQGTTSTKSIVFSVSGDIISVCRRPTTQIYPENGWVEQSPNDILTSVISTMQDAYQEAVSKNADIKCIGITNQRETVVVWDKQSGEPIYNAIAWQDRRTTNQIDYLRKLGVGDLVKKSTGLVLDPYFSAAKIAWILDTVKGARKRAQKNELLFGTIDSYLIWKLTGGKHHKTDVTNASRTSLFNIKSLTWDTELLKIFNIPESVLPTVSKSAEYFGEISKTILDRTLPIFGVAGDQQSAMIGQSCFQAGQVKSTYGTGCFLLANTGHELLYSQNNLISTICYQVGDEISYGLEGSIFMAGASLDWMKDNLNLINNLSETESISQNLTTNGGVIIVPAFTGLGAPWWKPNARAAIYGLTRQVTKNELIRATVESVAYQTNDLVNCMIKDGVTPTEIRVDGGMVANHWFLKFLSDITQLKIKKPLIMESTALGAAMLAALGSGLLPSLEDISSRWRASFETTPNMLKKERAELTDQWTKAVRATIAFHEN